MKVLILSCHTGEGHNAAARAIKAQFDNLAISCDIEDALRFGFKGKSALFSKGHVFLYKHLPRVFGAGYAMLEMNRKNHALPLLYRTGKGAVKKLQAFVIENGYDPVYGARPLKRFIQSSVETAVAKHIIKSQLKEGSVLTVDAINGELLVEVKS